MADRTVLPPIGPGGMLSQSYNSQDSRPSSRSSTTSTAYTWAPPPSADHHGFYRANNRSTTRSNNGRVVKLPAINKGKNGPGISHASSVKTLDRLGSSLHTPRGNRWRDPAGFVRYSADEDCLKCMLGVPHKKCEAHKYIRVGGGYRHSYWHVKAMLLEIEFKRQQEIMRQQRLEAIQEKTVHAVKTYIRTKSGRLVERIIFMSDEDYKAFQKAQKEGGDPTEFLKKYLSKEDAKNLDSYDKEEQRAIKTFIRTKSGRLIEKLVYVSKSDYEAMKRGDVDANTLLKKHMKLEDGETIEGWGEAKMRTITTKIRTKSGRIIEKTIQISEEDYQRMMKGGKDVQDEILRKYMKVEEGEEIAGWEKPKSTAMKVVKTYIRTKSGRLIEKTILMTEDEFAEFQKSGGDVNFLKKFIKLEQGEEIENWEKASTVYSASDDEETLAKMKPGTRVRGKDGELYEYVVDPITGKMFKKKVARADSDDSGIGSINKGRFTKKGANGMAEIDEEAYKKHKAGKRMEGSDSEYSYKSFMSDGGTRHVQRRKKLAGGRRGSAHSYHSSEDEEGAARRRRRRRAREHGADSAHSYYSVVSEGGTRRVRRKKKLPGGGYAKSESYHSDTSEKIKAQKRKKKRGRDHGADSDHSYYSEVSAGGTHHRKRRQRIRDKQGNVIGYGKTENYTSSEDEGKGKKGKKKGRKEHGADSDHSYFSEVSEGGTKHRKRRARIRDKDGKVIGYGKAQDYSSSDDEDGKRKKKKKRGGPDSDHSYYSEVSAGGTRRVMKKKRIRDAQGKVIGHGKAEIASDSDSDSFISVSDGKGGKVRIRKQRGKEQAGHWKGETPVFSDATTDSDIVAEKLKNMTEEEKKVYLAEREARKAEREAKRKEKYGDKYDEMVEKNKQAKLVKEARKKYENEKAEAAAKAKSMVTYGKGRGRMGSQDMDDRGIGLAHEDWGKTKGKGKKGKDGHEADGEGDDGEYGEGRKKKGRKGSGASSFSGESVWSVDADGNKIKKKIKMKGGKRYEYTYDAKGNLIKKKEVDDASSDGDYFEIDPVTGEVRLKAGKAKIDIKKLTDADLRRLGIDPTLPKSEIKRLLMEKFGKDIDIVDRGKKIGMKTLADYGSDVNTDDLANDSDFDVTTLRGTRKVNVKMRRGGQALLDHLKRIIEDSKLKSDYANDLDERDGDIDYLAHYRLVDAGKVEMYAKAFVVEDEDFDAALSYKELRFGLDGVPTVQHLTKKQMEYVFKVLKLDDASQVTFKMFAVISALCERVTQMDPYCKHLLEISNLLDIERKMDLYKAMFYCNTSADRDANFITSESLKIELIAGGLNWKQQEFIMDKMMPNKFREINFLDYMCYIPLFLSMHENICDNPLDMSDGKYSGMLRRHSIQRDMNPLGYQMHNSTAFILRKKAHDLLEGKVKADITKENMELLEKYSKLPSMIGATKQGATDTPGTNSKQKKEDDWSTNIFANDDFDDK
ncbi:uncharacterized protein LOC135490795 isoform X2 [Lineus longissimus]|uniref:uncharacterized protein LOC135490795 isoform X2 n=1 Tax=Lineus longissimus TaxID=88925 RepID=UPI002B4D6737